MASKNKKKPEKPSEAGGGPRAEVERLFAKEHYKDAVKQAKICHRDDPTPENHRLLERAYFLRADELRRKGMPVAAQEVAMHLVGFGVTDPDLRAQAGDLMMAVGLLREADRLRGDQVRPEDRERLARQEADLAVLHPERCAQVPAEVRALGQRVRQAIDAVQRDEAEKGLEALREVPRGSPFADWRLFVRGLAAHAQDRLDEARAAWERLEADRPASRIARALQARSGQLVGTAADVEALERRVFGAPVLGQIDQLKALLAEGRWDEAVKRVATLRHLLARIDPALAVRLTGVLYVSLVREVGDRDYRPAMRLLNGFIAAAEPLPLDPQWERLRAMCWEGPQAGLDEAETYWRKYIKDLGTLPALSAEERPLAQALVLKNLAAKRIDEARALDDVGSGPFQMPASPQEVRRERERAIAFAEEALALAPGHRPTYLMLLKAYHDWDRPNDAAKIAHRMIERFPDDVEALIDLTQYHYEKGQPVEALAHVRRARALKPLDNTLQSLEWMALIQNVRALSLQGRHDEARATLGEAESMNVETKDDLHQHARRAALEIKAGQMDRAREHIADGLEGRPDSAAFWLDMVVESARFQLPKAECERFEANWAAALSQKKVSGEAAGRMALFMRSLLEAKVDYPGRARHVKQLVQYLGRTTRTKYEHDSLLDVCAFLVSLKSDMALAEKLIKRGLKLFPKSIMFHLTMATFLSDLKRVSNRNFNAIVDHLTKAEKLAEETPGPEAAQLLPEVRQRMDIVRQMRAGPFGMGPRFSFSPAMFEAMRDLYGDDDDDDEFDDDRDDEDGPPGPIPMPARAPSRRPAKPKTKTKRKSK